MIESLALVGFMASGKTTVGQRMGTLLGKPFIDLDQRVEALAGLSIPEIFRDEGEPSFRAHEAEALRSVLSGPPCVLACGGGTVQDALSRDLLRRRSRVVWLDLRFETVRARLSSSDASRRPLVATLLEEGLLELYRSRRRDYAAVADLRVEVDHRSARQLAGWILGALEELPPPGGEDAP